MYPLLFNKKQILFSTKESGYVGILSECITCKVSEERNGSYELEFTYPQNGLLANYIANDMFVYSKVDDSDDDDSWQPFRIYDIIKTLSGIITVKARHISYQLNYNIVGFIPYKKRTAKTAIREIQAAKDGDDIQFSLDTNISSSEKYFSVEKPASVRNVIGGTNGFLETYGGEVKWNNRNVFIYANRGSNKGITVRYGKDLTELQQEENIESTYTSICGYYYKEASNNEAEKKIQGSIINHFRSSYFPYKRVYNFDTTQYLDNEIHTGYKKGSKFYADRDRTVAYTLVENNYYIDQITKQTVYWSGGKIYEDSGLNAQVTAEYDTYYLDGQTIRKGYYRSGEFWNVKDPYTKATKKKGSTKKDNAKTLPKYSHTYYVDNNTDSVYIWNGKSFVKQTGTSYYYSGIKAAYLWNGKSFTFDSFVTNSDSFDKIVYKYVNGSLTKFTGTYPTKEDINRICKEYLNAANFCVPSVNLTFSYQPLWQTVNYKNWKNVEHVKLCDIVTVIFEKLNISTTAEVTKLEYNVLANRYNSITITSVNGVTSNGNSLSTSSSMASQSSSLTAQAITSTNITNKLLDSINYISNNLSKFQNFVNGKLEAASADIKDLKADKADVEELTATDATIQNLDADKADIDDLTATNAKIENLESTKATIEDLTATNAKIETLDAEKADIDLANVKQGSITTAMLGDAVVGTAQIADGSITDGKVVSLSASKLTAGTIDASSIDVTNLKAENITVGQINGKQIAPGAVSVENLGSDVTDTLDTMQSQIDGDIQTWTGTDVPTLLNSPAKDWSYTEKETHVGDIYYDIDNHAYRFRKNSDGSFEWQLLKDTDVTNAQKTATDAQNAADKAQQLANDAQSAIDKEIENAKAREKEIQESTDKALELAGAKRRIFNSTPTVPYDEGDVWMQGSSGDIYICATARSTGSYTASDWVPASKYTDDTYAKEVAKDLADNYYTTTTVDKKFTDAEDSWTSSISASAATTLKSAQDDATTKANTAETNAKTYTQNQLTNYSTTTEMNSAISQSAENITSTVSKTYSTKTELQTVSDTANSKNKTFSQTSAPTSGMSTGDLWVDTDDSNKTYRYDGKSWVSVRDGYIDTAKASAIKTASDDATTKANTAETNAKTYTQNQLTNYSTTTEMNSAISQSAENITSTVSKTYTTKTDFNNLSIGGSNLITGSDIYIDKETAGYTSGYSENYKNLASGDKLTISVQIDIENSAASTGSRRRCGTEISIPHGSTTTYIGVWRSLGSAITSFHGRISKTYTVDFGYSDITKIDTCNIYEQDVVLDDGGYIKVSRPKLEFGDKATDWSPAPEDIVSESKDYTDSKLENYSTTEDTKSLISQTATDITAEVSKTYTTLTSFNSYKSSNDSAVSNAQNTANKNVKTSIQLWYTKADTTAPSAPTSKVTSTSTSGNVWTTVVPSYNSSYPNYYYCFQYTLADGTVSWSDVVHDIAMGETQSTARTAKTNADKAQSNLDSYKTTVSETYATQAALKTTDENISAEITARKTTDTNVTNLSNNLSNNYSTTTQMNSAINAKADEINSTVKAIKVGGRNLLLNSSFSENLNKWSVSGSGWEIVEEDGYNCVHVSGALKTSKTLSQTIACVIGDSEKNKVKDGETYTISGYYKSKDIVNGTTNTYVAPFYTGYNYYPNGDTTQSVKWQGSFDVVHPTGTHDWTYFSRQLTFTNLDYRKSVYVLAEIYARDFTGDLYVRDLKLELGNKATEWTPAPEDVDGDISEVESRLSTAESSITQNTSNIALKVSTTDYTGAKVASLINQSASTVQITASHIDIDGTITAINNNTKTTIDGSKITTGSITADQIKADTITGTKIAANTITSDKLTVGNGVNLYDRGYDTFSQITNDTLYYSKNTNVTVTLDTLTTLPGCGSKCAKLVTNSSVTDGYVYFGHSSTSYGCIPVNSGKTYIVSCWMKASTTVSAQLFVIGHTGINETNPSHMVTTKRVGTSWTRAWLSYMAASAYPYISIRVDNDTPSSTLWVAGIQIETGTASQEPSDFHPAGMTIINGNNILTGTITANRLVSKTITANSGIIADAAITSAMIADASIITAKIKDASITNAKISDINASKITSGEIDADRIGAGTITGTKLSADAIDGKTITGATINGGVINGINSNNENYLEIKPSGIKAKSTGANGSTMSYVTIASQNVDYPSIFITDSEDNANGSRGAVIDYNAIKIRDMYGLDASPDNDYPEMTSINMQLTRVTNGSDVTINPSLSINKKSTDCFTVDSSKVHTDNYFIAKNQNTSFGVTTNFQSWVKANTIHARTNRLGVASIYLFITITASGAFTAGKVYTIGTISSSYLPSYYAYSRNMWSTKGAYYQLSSSGELQMWTQDAISNGTSWNDVAYFVFLT